MGARRIRQTQIEAGNARGVGAGTAATDPWENQHGEANTGVTGTVAITFATPGFKDQDAYFGTASYKGGADAVELRITYTSGTSMSITGAANRDIRWLASGVRAS